MSYTYEIYRLIVATLSPQHSLVFRRGAGGRSRRAREARRALETGRKLKKGIVHQHALETVHAGVRKQRLMHVPVVPAYLSRQLYRQPRSCSVIGGC